MTYRFLAPHLHATADAARAHFETEYGAKAFRIEEAIHADLPLTPTFSASLPDGAVLAIETSERAYSNTIDSFVVQCTTQRLPIRLWVVVPSAKADPDFASNLRRASGTGVGVLMLGTEGKHTYRESVSLSLFGLRRIDLKAFPTSLRGSLRQAEETFLNGNPNKGCQAVFEELEAITRAFAKRTHAMGLWSKPAGTKSPKINLQTGAWLKVLEELQSSLDIVALRKKCPVFKSQLISAAIAATDPRNITSHKPKTMKAVVERDTKLRTMFEHSADLLQQWSQATKPLKL